MLDSTQALKLATANDTTFDVLVELSRHQQLEVRRAVANNPNTSVEILARLGREFPEEIVANPVFSVLMRSDPSSHFCQLSLGRSRTTEKDVLVRLFDRAIQTIIELESDEDDESIYHTIELAEAIAMNDRTPSEILDNFVNSTSITYRQINYLWDYNIRILAAIADNPNAPELLLFEIAKYPDYRIERAIARHLNAPVSLLERFIDRQDFILHERLAQNPRTPAHIIEKLAREDNRKIRNLVRVHPNVSPKAIAIVDFLDEGTDIAIDLLTELASDRRIYIQTKIVRYSQTPTDILGQLIQNSIDAKTNLCDGNIPEQAIGHPNCDVRTLEIFAKYLLNNYRSSSAPEINYFTTHTKLLITDPRVNLNIINTLAKTNNHFVMTALAESPLTPPEMLLEIADFPTFDIHDWHKLAKNINTPSAAIEKIYEKTLMMLHPNTIDCLQPLLSTHPNTALSYLE